MFTAERLFGPAAVSSGTGLLHEPFLDRARADRVRGDDGSARSALGAYLVARLVDAWLELEEGPDAPDEARQAYSWQLESTRRYVTELSGDCAETRHLAGLLGALDRRRGRQVSAVRNELVAFAYFLENEGRLLEALDIAGAAARTYAGSIPAADFATLGLLVGRLFRKQAKWQEANRAYSAAEEAAVAIADRRSVLLSRLGRANVLRGEGNLPASRAAVEAVIAEASAPELQEVRGRAYGDLAAVLELQGLRIEALEANYDAVRLASDALNRMRMLGDLGVKLAELGQYKEARLAFDIVVASDASFVVRANARLELMDLESTVGNRVAFERHRLELGESASRMTPSMAVDYRYKVGVGLARFGKFARARAVWEEGLQLAREHRLNEWYFRLERMLRHLDGCAGCVAQESEAEPAAARQAVARVTAGLRQYAALAPA